jgi:hypothetical protein
MVLRMPSGLSTMADVNINTYTDINGNSESELTTPTFNQCCIKEMCQDSRRDSEKVLTG